MLYLPRIAAAAAGGIERQALRIVAIAVLLVAVVGAVAALGLGVAGDVVTAALFGPELVLAPGPRIAIAVGMAMFLVALVLSDGAVGMRRHGFVSVTWIVSIAFGALAALVVPGGMAKVTAPLIVGSAVAIVLLAVRMGLHRRKVLEQHAD